MPSNAIEIDDEALDLLRNAQLVDETISATIKRLARRPAHLESWFKEIDQVGPPSPEFSSHFRIGDDDPRFSLERE